MQLSTQLAEYVSACFRPLFGCGYAGNLQPQQQFGYSAAQAVDPSRSFGELAPGAAGALTFFSIVQRCR